MFFHKGVSYHIVKNRFFLSLRHFPVLKRVNIKHKVNKNAAVWTWSSRIAQKILRVSLSITQISICDHRDSYKKQVLLIEFFWAHIPCSQAVSLALLVSPSPLLCFSSEIKALYVDKTICVVTRNRKLYKWLCSNL